MRTAGTKWSTDNHPFTGAAVASFFAIENRSPRPGNRYRYPTEFRMKDSNPYESPNTPSEDCDAGTHNRSISRVPLFTCLFASALSTALLFFAVTMFFVFPAINTLATGLLLVANRSSWRQPTDLSRQWHVALTSGILAFFLVVLPWLQVFTNTVLPIYGEVSWWFNHAIQWLLDRVIPEML